MAPILGIYASQISGHLFAPSGAYDSIATVTVVTSTPTITFTSIPSTYKHLQIRMFARSDRAASTNDSAILRYNSDTNSNNYTYHELAGTGAATSAYGSGAPESTQMQFMTATSATTGVFGIAITDILDYSNTNKYKTQRNLGGFDNNGSGLIRLNSSLWMNTAAISSITITSSNSANFIQDTQFALYGVKGN
jgi:hypothetical protein